MRVLVQRTGKANCIIDNKVISSIDSGLVLLVGFAHDDDENTIE